MKTYRTKLLVNPQFQLQLITLSFIPSLIALGVYYAQSFNGIKQLKKMLSSVPPELKNTTLQTLDKYEIALGQYFFWSSIVVLIVSAFILLVISHRVAGPLFRLENHLKEINETKDIKLIRFRKKDFLQNLEIEINKLLSDYKKSNSNRD